MEPGSVTVLVKYIGSSPGGAMYDRDQKKRVTYVRGYSVRVSENLAEELLENPADWAEVKE